MYYAVYPVAKLVLLSPAQGASTTLMAATADISGGVYMCVHALHTWLYICMPRRSSRRARETVTVRSPYRGVGTAPEVFDYVSLYGGPR